MSGLKLPRLGESLEDPIELANGRFLRGHAPGSPESILEARIGIPLWGTLVESLWGGIRDPLASLRHSLGEPR